LACSNCISISIFCCSGDGGLGWPSASLAWLRNLSAVSSINPSKPLYKQTVLLYRTNGGEFDKVEYPHIELLCMELGSLKEDVVSSKSDELIGIYDTSSSFISELYATYYYTIDSIKVGVQFKSKLMYQKEDFNSSLIDLRKYVETIDDEVSKFIQDFVQKGFTPIVIGGGHNNSYPILKGIYNAKQNALDCINIDPHFDFRAIEGRHSGNGFSYAKQNGYLNEYAVFGFHENYNNQYMLDALWAQNPEKCISFESLIFNNINYMDAWQTLLSKFDDSIGLEIDLDSVAMMPTSAYTPSGFSFEDLRRFLYFTKNNKNIEYLHIAEGNVAHQMQAVHVSKSIAFLLADLLRK
jgi:arginase family enzyme